jgi:para-aminobenzoate synthetase/4-amino-4-deoxychorismate lyase
VFETLRVAERAAFFWPQHHARLVRGAEALGLAPPPTTAVEALLQRALAELPNASLVVRLAWCPPRLHLAARAPTLVPTEPALFVGPTASPLRPFGAKTLARAPYSELLGGARASGAFEALVHTPEGLVIEGTFTNLFLARAGRLVTPPTADGALPGIARAALLADLERRPVETGGCTWTICERTVSLEELFTADGVLLTNSALQVVDVARILGRAPIWTRSGPCQLARELRRRFEALEAASERIQGRGGG